MKFCVDCKHYVLTRQGSICAAQVTKEENLVDGVVLTVIKANAFDMRYKKDALCGTEAKLYQPKQITNKVLEHLKEARFSNLLAYAISASVALATIIVYIIK